MCAFATTMICPLPILRIGNDLRVPTADVEDDRICCSGYNSTHFDMGYAMIHTNERLAPQLQVATSHKFKQNQRSANPTCDKIRATTAQTRSGPPIPGPLV